MERNTKLKGDSINVLYCLTKSVDKLTHVSIEDY